MAIRGMRLRGATKGGRGALSPAEEEKLKQGQGGDDIFSPVSTEEITEPSVFDPEEPQTFDVEPGKVAEPEEPAKDAMLQGGGSLAGVTPDRQPVRTAQPAPAPIAAAEEEPSGPQDEQGLFDDLEDINERQKQEREAFADELESRKAEAEMAAQARAGLGGMGLSGATTALVGDVGRQEERAGDIAMADLARRQQQETFDELRRQASIWAFEEEFGEDLDKDGIEGPPSGGDGGDEDLFGGRQGTKTQEQAKESLAESGIDPATLEEGSFLDDIALNNTLVETYTDDLGRIIKIYRRPDGTYFKQTTLR